MSSMTDVVFLLLIFFMVTSTLVSPNAIKLLFPQKNMEKLQEDPPKEVVISVNQQSDKTFTYKLNKKNVEAELLKGKIIEEFENADNAVIILKTADEVPVEEAVRIIEMMKDYNYRIIFSMQPN